LFTTVEILARQKKEIEEKMLHSLMEMVVKDLKLNFTEYTR